MEDTKRDRIRCPSDETLMLFVDGVLEARSSAGVRSHVDDCDACRELLAQVARVDDSQNGAADSDDLATTMTAATTGKRRKLHLEAGDVVGEKYRVEGVIGAGGMGHVFAARHLELERRVAIKVMLPEMLDHSDSVPRFIREAKAAGALRSEHAVRIFDIGRLESQAPYIVMEYLEGQDLMSRLTDGGALPIREAIDYMLQACDAIAEAHAAGVVHRDLKPHNLFVTRGRDGEPFIKVLDFGLAKDLSPIKDAAKSGELTQTNVMLGSPLYMSPEQVRSSRDVDRRTDVWSLGATLYHLVAGVPPFVAPDVGLVCQLIQRGSFAPLSTHRPDAPRALETVIRRCLHSDLDARYQSIAELERALRDVLVPQPVVAPIEPATLPLAGGSQRPAPLLGATARTSWVPGAPLPSVVVAVPVSAPATTAPAVALQAAEVPGSGRHTLVALAVATGALLAGVIVILFVRGRAAADADADPAAPDPPAATAAASSLPVPVPVPVPVPLPLPVTEPALVTAPAPAPARSITTPAPAADPSEIVAPKRDPRPATAGVRATPSPSPTPKRNAYDHL